MKIDSSERITVINGYDKNAYTYVPVIVVGAGESGIATACQLKSQLGFDQFRVYDRQSGFGGTWWINRYPGIACDVPCPYYSFSWRPNTEANELYPSGRELIRYFHTVASEYGVVDKFQLNTDISELRWLEDEQQWQATLRYMAPGTGDLPAHERNKLIREKGEDAVYLGQEIIRAKVVISCVGGLTEPNDKPKDVTGWEKFKGPLMHTARWQEDADLEGKDVVVVGTGCSAAQVVPRLTQAPYNARSVTQVMRSAPWVIPMVPEPGGKEWYAENAARYYKTFPGLHRIFRWYIAYNMESLWFRAFGDQERHRKARKDIEQMALKNMRKHVPEKYHSMLTPTFEVACKRRVIDREWYRGFNDPKIQLTTQKLVEVGEDSVRLQGGGQFPDREDDPTGQTDVTLKADAIVLANGFETTRWFHPIKVIGKGGRNIRDVWEERGGPQAYMCNAVDSFPNFFMICGPNAFTGHQSVILATENLVNYTIKFVREILTGNATTIEVKKSAEIAWAQRTQEDLKHRVFHVGGCTSWYFDAKTGWNSTMYPRSQIDHTLRCWFPTWSDWDIQLTGKGLIRKRIGQLIRAVSIGLVLVATYRLRQSGIQLKHLPTILKMSVKMGAMSLLGSIAAKAEEWQELL